MNTVKEGLIEKKKLTVYAGSGNKYAIINLTIILGYISYNMEV